MIGGNYFKSSVVTNIEGLTPTDSNFIVGNGTSWVAESGATARTSLGLGAANSPTFAGLSLGTGELTCGSINRASGSLTLEIGGTAGITVTSSQTTFAENIVIGDGKTIGQSAGPLLTFDDSNNYLEITGCSVGIGTATPVKLLHLYAGAGGGATPNSQTQILLEANDDAYIEFLTPTNKSGGLRWSDDEISRGAIAFSQTTQLMEFKTGASTALTIDAYHKAKLYGVLSKVDNTEGGTASLNIQTAHETHTLAAAGTSDTTTISIPSGATLLGASFCVNTAVVDDAGDDTWSAAFITGSTATLGTGEAAAQNTKVNTLIVPEISSDVCQIRFTANAGSFSAGVIEIVAYYIDLASLANV